MGHCFAKERFLFGTIVMPAVFFTILSVYKLHTFKNYKVL